LQKLKIICPYCREGFELEAYLKDSIMVQVIRMLPEFGGHGRVVWEYCELFRVGPPLNARKLHRVMSDVLAMFKAGGFEFQRRRYEISRDGVARALQTVCNANLKGELNSHNYLKKCAIAIAEEEAERRSKEYERKGRIRESGIKNEVRPGVEGDPAGVGRTGNLGPLIKSFVQGLEGGRPEGAAAHEYDPTDARIEADRAVDRSRGVMRPEREP
jgi:hypothetical protein